MECPNCKHESDEDVCPECGTTIVSDPNDKIEELVQAASIPDLADLFRQGKARGLIKATKEYGQSA